MTSTAGIGRNIRSALAATVAMLMAMASAAQEAGPRLAVVPGCLPHEQVGCGCSLRFAGQACRADDGLSRFHSYAELYDGSPLRLVINGKQLELQSRRPRSQVFSFSRGDSWQESYSADDIAVTVRYRPVGNTCAKAAAEPCEYFDVQGEVSIESGHGKPVTFQGVGMCGC